MGLEKLPRVALRLMLYAALFGGFVACGANVGSATIPPEPPAPTRTDAPRPLPSNTLLPTNTPPPTNTSLPVTTEIPSTPMAPGRALAQISGRVTNTRGEPIARARLAFSESDVPLPDMAYLTNADGSFHLRVPRGQYTLVVFASGYVSQERQLDTRTRGEVQVDFVLPTLP
jgi:hypothetical protein